MENNIPEIPVWVYIVGSKNSGKTTLVEEIVTRLSNEGYSVGTVKHSSHRHEVDTPGKDSWRHKQAGANKTALVSESKIGLFFEEENREALKERLLAEFVECDFVIVEGNKTAENGLKIEVWRKEVSSEPLCTTDQSIRFIVTDDNPLIDLKVTHLARSNLDELFTVIIGHENEQQ